MSDRGGPSRRPLQAGPDAPDAVTRDEWLEAQRRRRMLSGLWRTDLERAMNRLLDARRVRSWGHGEKLDLAKNLFRSVVLQLSILYDRDPVLEHADGEASEALRDVVSRAGLWQLAGQLQRYVIAQREAAMLVHPSVLDGRPGLTFEVVPRDLLHAEAAPGNPDEPVRLYVYRLRDVEFADGPREIWTRDCYDISDPALPAFTVQDEKGNDISARAGIEPMAGDAYRWRYSDGRPFIPGELYHATRTGQLFDSMQGVELVDGALKVACLWTFWGHVVRDCSFPQRWVSNGAIDGAHVDSNGDARVVTDPASILVFRSQPGASFSAGQFSAGGSPSEIGDSLRDYQSDLASEYDLTPSDIQRANGDARSGYAISLTTEGKRNAQRRFEPQFRRADERLLAKAAAILNLIAGAEVLPESGYQLRYTGVPPTFEERRLMMQEYQARIAGGTMSKVQLLAKLEDISEQQARDQLRRVMADAVEFADGAETELNGAQVAAASEIVSRVAFGAIPRASGISMLQNFFGLDEAAAVAVMATAGAGFKPTSTE